MTDYKEDFGTASSGINLHVEIEADSSALLESADVEFWVAEAQRLTEMKMREVFAHYQPQQAEPQQAEVGTPITGPSTVWIAFPRDFSRHGEQGRGISLEIEEMAFLNDSAGQGVRLVISSEQQRRYANMLIEHFGIKFVLRDHPEWGY